MDKEKVDFVELSHLANLNHYHQSHDTKFEMDDIKKAYNPKHPNNWMFYSQLSNFDPVFKYYSDSTWVTLGDGKFGREAFYIQNAGMDVLATDMDLTLLEASHKFGGLAKIKQENAEQLSFANKSFDFVFCKEMLHHLARPYMALYEMHRVSRKAFAFIEPLDPQTPSITGLYCIAQQNEQVRQALKLNDCSEFEVCGNYAYKFSHREMEKFALGLGLTTLAYKGINVTYIHSFPSYEKEKGDEYRMDDNSKLVEEFRQELNTRDYLCQKGLREWESFAWIMFKDEEVPEDLLESLQELGWTVKHLARNPHIDSYHNMAALNKE